MNRHQHIKAFVAAILLAVLLSLFLMEDTLVRLATIIITLSWISIASLKSFQMKRSIMLRILPALLFAAIAWTHLPLKLAFHLYRPDFDRVAAQIKAGTPATTPFWIGPFKIKMVGQRTHSTIPHLATNQEAWEIDGFVPHPEGHGFNIWSCIKLDDTWSYIAED